MLEACPNLFRASRSFPLAVRTCEASQVVATELGMPWPTLARWSEPQEHPSQPATLVPVRLSLERQTGGANLCLLCPGGYRLEGLSIAMAAELLPRLLP